MRFKRTGALGVAALSAAAMGAIGLADAGSAAAATPIPVVTVHMSAHHVRLSTGNTLHAGRVIYRVVTGTGDHALQIARLHRGYSLKEAGQDLGKAFGGDVRAIRRVDSHVTFRGGAETKPGHPGRFSTTLTRGSFVFLDQNGSAFTTVRVVGKAPDRPAIPAEGSITAFSYGFGSAPRTLPASGWIRVFNQSDQPHFVVFQHVKARTTPAMVRRFLTPHNANRRPPWLAKGSTSTGVISPYFGEKFHTHLPAGKYLIACFWPDDDSGMPHAFMGMWRLVRLT